jgi:hypothetical protein
MPIKITGKRYTDIYGNATSYLKANAGDKIDVKYTINTEIFAKSSNVNNWTINAIDNQITQSQGSFIDEGFRVGQTYYLKTVNNVNTVTYSYTGTISEVGDLYIKMSGLPSINNWNSASDNTLCLFVETTRKSIELGINFVDNTNQNPSLQSFIDQEVTRFVANGLDALAVSSTLALNQTGKKSGSYAVTNAQIKRIADSVNPYGFTHNQQNWEVTFTFIFPSLFSEDSFIGQNCWKLFSKIDFKVNEGETFGITTIQIKDSADTGFFDTGFNTEVSNVLSVISDANELFYNKQNIVTFEIVANDIFIDDIEFGFAYITIDDALNKNKPLSQENYIPFGTSGLWNASNITDNFNSDVFPYSVTLNDLTITDLGGERTFAGELLIDPLYASSVAFGKFIEGRGTSERLVYLWVKVGNTNTLLFSGQMTFELPVGVLITPELSILVNHDQNIDFSDLSTPSANDDFNIEDDLGYISDILIYSADSNESVTCKIIAKNGTDEFDLETISFDLSNQDLTNFVNEYLSVSNNLPLSSAKKQSYLIQNTALSGGSMKLRLYYPFLIHWEYWIEQFNADAFFKKNNTNNKNWFNYQTSPWSVKLKVEINRNGVADYFYKSINFVDYDDSTITSTIKLYDYATMLEVSSLKKDALIFIEATHNFNVNYSGFPYGQITIEPSESSPRYVLSTEIDSDKTSPLKGISYEPRLDIDFTTSQIITLSCLVDMKKLQGTNYCITSKISEEGTNNNPIIYDKIMEDGTLKITEDLETKITE